MITTRPTICGRAEWVPVGLLAVALLALSIRPACAGNVSTEQPRRGGTLRLAFPSDWRSLDPVIAFDGGSLPLQKLLFRGLIDFDSGTNLVPDQASDWNISPDGKTYTFHLRPGVRFSNGREVEADDYVFSLERVLNPATGSECQIYFLDILGARAFRDGKAPHVAGLRAPDHHTLIIELEKPTFTFRYVLAMASADVVPRDLVQQFGKDFQYHMAGSGPYRIAKWSRGISYHLERNPFYSGTDGLVDAVDIIIGPDPALRTMMLERGEVDLALATPPDVVRFQHDPARQFWLHRIDAAITDYVFMNTEVKPFDDPRVRRAVFHAVNVERMLKLTRGFGVEARGIVPPSLPWSNPRMGRHDFDPEKSRKLLAEAGYPNGFRAEFWYRTTPPLYAREAQGVQQDLHQVGIEAELRGVTLETLVVKVGARRQVPFGLSAWGEDYPDPSDFLDILFNGQKITETDCNNVAFYSNPRVNALLDRAAGSIDADFRKHIFQDAEELIMNDAPWVPLLHEQLPLLANPRLRNVQPHPVYGWRYEGMWLDH